MAAGTAMTPECGHTTHEDGCGPCEAGMRRLRHCVDAHGMYAAECPRCKGKGCDGCGDGEVFAFPIGPGQCDDGALCLLGQRFQGPVSA